MRVAVGSDHAGFALKEQIGQWLKDWGHDVQDVGTTSTASVDYPDFAQLVGQAVVQGHVDTGILICGSGIGMSIAANKIPGVRAAVCQDLYAVQLTRNDNDANVLCLGARLIGPGLAQAMVRAWLETPFAGGRHVRRVEKISRLEKMG